MKRSYRLAAALLGGLAFLCAIQTSRAEGTTSSHTAVATCKVILSYSNRCGVMTVGDNGYAASSGPTMAEATKKSMKKCESDGDKGCHVYYSGCSSPVLVQ